MNLNDFGQSVLLAAILFWQNQLREMIKYETSD